jgi:putative oxidoreductase
MIPQGRGYMDFNTKIWIKQCALELCFLLDYLFKRLLYLFEQITKGVPMNIAGKIAQYLLGLIFVVFGLNYFLHFIPMPPMEGVPGQYMGILYTSKYLLFVKILEIVAGLMLLAGFKRALAWALILPVTVNILMFEVLIVGQPGMGLLLLALNALGVWADRERFAPLCK